MGPRWGASVRRPVCACWLGGVRVQPARRLRVGGASSSVSDEQGSDHEEFALLEGDKCTPEESFPYLGTSEQSIREASRGGGDLGQLLGGDGPGAGSRGPGRVGCRQAIHRFGQCSTDERRRCFGV